MAIPLPQALDDCRREEGKLSHLLADENVKFQQIEQSLTRHRVICSDVLLSDFEAATGSGFRAEDRLWDNHQKVNARFRTAMANMRNTPGQKAVELRKLGHEYLKFIKSSQTFYRNLIKRLNQAYGGIPALEHVAKKLNSDLRSNTGRQSNFPPAAQLELCCHRTLIRLGDLSRYRETELAGTEKNWAPAYGYYDLALAVCPGSGVPFNQRAVIALAEKTLFRAIYYVYRSISAEEPHPQGDMNLRRALHKVQQAWNSKDLVNDPRATSGSALPKGMVAWYLRLLEMFYHGKATSEKEELENEVISQLEVDLEQNPSADSPHKFIVASIAAQHTAQERFESKQSANHQNSYILFLGLNVKILECLLRLFVKELEAGTENPSSNPGHSQRCADQLNPVLRRVLPALRLYDLWLEGTCEIIDSPASSINESQKSELWSLYAKTLSLMSTAFPPQDLPNIEHMLEEDEDTIGFKPLYSEKTRDVWYRNGHLKPRWHDVSHEMDRSHAEEMLYRIREFMVRGLELVIAKRVPIDFDQSRCRFSYQRGGPSVSITARQSLMDNNDSVAQTNAVPLLPKTNEVQDKEAERMVDDIVGETPNSPLLALPSAELGAHSEYPTTPPHPSTNRSSYGTVSPFPMGTHTVNDIMAVAYKQPKSTSPRVQAPVMQQSRSSSRPSSQLQSPAIPPPLPRADSETSVGSAKVLPRMQYYPEDPQLPGLGVLPVNSTPSAQPKLSSPPTGRPSPLPPPLSHSRVNSSDSTRGIWGGGIFTPSFQPTDARRTSGNISLGYSGIDSSTASSSRVPNSFPDTERNSPALQNTASMPWNHSLHESSKAFPTTEYEGPEDSPDPQAKKLSWSAVAGRGTATWQQT